MKYTYSSQEGDVDLHASSLDAAGVVSPPVGSALQEVRSDIARVLASAWKRDDAVDALVHGGVENGWRVAEVLPDGRVRIVRPTSSRHDIRSRMEWREVDAEELRAPGGWKL